MQPTYPLVLNLTDRDGVALQTVEIDAGGTVTVTGSQQLDLTVTDADGDVLQRFHGVNPS